jgi:HSP20 family protein
LSRQEKEADLVDFMPAIDVKENEQEFIIKVELPGVEEKNVDVTITADEIVIKGEKNEDKEDKRKNYYYMERSYGSFNRLIPLTVEVESGNEAASFHNGVLNIKIPKKQSVPAKGTKISYQSFMIKMPAVLLTVTAGISRALEYPV